MSSISVISSQIAYQYLKNQISSDVEEFWVLALSSKKCLLASRMIFRGTVDRCVIHPRDIFRFAIQQNASSLLVAHNHPSGDCKPSSEDVRITDNLIQAAQLLQIPIVDHLVLTTETYYSFKDRGHII
ncbi:MAG: RadC family protein [Bdellovibrionales bacterium]